MKLSFRALILWTVAILLAVATIGDNPLLGILFAVLGGIAFGMQVLLESRNSPAETARDLEPPES